MVALGKGETDEYKDNLHKVGETLDVQSQKTSWKSVAKT